MAEGGEGDGMSEEFRRIWRIPLATGFLTVATLVAALVVGGVGRFVAWGGLAAPLLLIGWHLERSLREGVRDSGAVSRTDSDGS
jgi:hypothetical protein